MTKTRNPKPMDFSEDWKRQWAISSVFSAPLLNPNTSQNPNDPTSLGPLLFKPTPSSLLPLFSSPSHLSPRLPPPAPDLTLKRFLSTTSSSPVPYSTASSLISDNTLTHSDYQTHNHKLNNNLQLLTCPFSSRVYVFLPAGENLEKIGVLVVFVNKDVNFDVKHNNGKPFLVDNNVYQHRIMKLKINPVIDCLDEFEDGEGFVRIAYLVVCSEYCVTWYSVKARRDLDSGGGSCCPVVEGVGCKRFKSSSVVDVCWSPHFVEECVVLLEDGGVWLFDVSLGGRRNRLAGKKLGILWDVVGDEGGGKGWLGCEFSWDPRILVVVHSNRVFFVDTRSRDFKVWSLLDIESVSSKKNDVFVALSMADTDGFRFVVASKEVLLLCDVRMPKMPLLRWVHGLESPNHISVSKLSELRPISSEEEMYDWASKSGYCILLGSFFDGEFNIFCYGPDYGTARCSSKPSNANNIFYAWGLPSDISLSGRGCHCGTCLVREDFAKEGLYKWIDWRQRKELVMGFGILKKEITSQLSGPTGGFHLIRLMSSGKLEVQRYSAAWKLEQISEKAHKESIFDGEDNQFYDIGEPNDDLPKRHQFVTLANMKSFLSDNEAPESYGDILDGYAVNLGDNTEDFDFKTPIHTKSSRVNHSNRGSNPDQSAVVTSTNQSSASKVKKEAVVTSTNQSSGSRVKKEAVGPELFDEGCSYDLKFDDDGIELGQQGLQMSNWLVMHNSKFKESLKS